MLLRLCHHKGRGMTLIETLMVMLMVGILAAIAAPSYLNWLHQKSVEDALARVTGAIKEAQKEAVKRGTDCWVNIPKGVGQSITGNCLITGDRTIKDVELQHRKTNGGVGVWKITFGLKGGNAPDSAGTLVLSSPASSGKQLCLVISAGIGLMRTGTFTGGPVKSSECITS